MPISELRHDPNNVRVHPEENMVVIRQSLNRFGQRNLLVTLKAERGLIVMAGNARLDAMRQLGWTHAAVVQFDESESEAMAYAVADNRTADLSVFDDEKLHELVAHLNADGISLEGIGFTLEDFGLGDESEKPGSNDDEPGQPDDDNNPEPGPNAETIRVVMQNLAAVPEATRKIALLLRENPEWNAHIP